RYPACGEGKPAGTAVQGQPPPCCTMPCCTIGAAARPAPRSYTKATVTSAWSGARPLEIPSWLWFNRGRRHQPYIGGRRSDSDRTEQRKHRHRHARERAGFMAGRVGSCRAAPASRGSGGAPGAHHGGGRRGRRDAITAYLDPAVMVPAGGQGALGIQARADDARVHDLVAPLADRATTLCCTAERRLQEVLEGGCRVPIGALALLEGETLTLDAVVASEDGTLLVRDRLTGPAGDPRTVGERLAE